MEDVGRNDPCWCKSGKKFKKCHLDREREAPLTRADFEVHTKKNSKKCSARSLSDGACTSKIINAHTISKGGCLKTLEIAGHVLGTKPSISELEKSEGTVGLHKVGLKDASTFTGFCSYHDKALFAPLEDQPIILSDAQLFLLTYRSLSRELYAKEENLRTAEFIKISDRGMSLPMQVIIQKRARNYEHEVNLALRELTSAKSSLDAMLVSEDYTGLNHFVIELSELPKILVSGSTQPDFDFKGNRLQTFGHSEKPMSHIIYNAISYENKGCFVFSWLENSDAVCRKFVDSLACMGHSEIADALVRFCYSYCENTWVSPAWWDTLEKSSQEDISRKLQLGMTIEHGPDDLPPNGIKFNAFKVVSTTLRATPNEQTA